MSGGPQAEKIRTLFNTIAGDYDRLNHWLSLGIDRTWRKRALKDILPECGSEERGESGRLDADSSAKADASRPYAVLDVACGTGDFSLEIARRCVRHSLPCTITGLDLSEGMLAVMREKVARAGFLEGASGSEASDSKAFRSGDIGVTISVLQGNSEAMPFDDGSFDCVTIAFGIRNFEHREQALQEILRVLKPGGRLVILELSVPATPVLRWCYNLYFTHILPWIGGWISGDKAAYRYLPASVLKFPGKEEWMQTMRSCGYTEVRHKAYTLGICRQYVGLRPSVRPSAKSAGVQDTGNQ